MRRPLACGQLCRAPPGELPRGRRSLAAGAICANGGVFALRRHAGEQRCAARWPAANCADRRSAFPGGRCHLREWRCLCLAASCGGAAMRRPLACGQLCRPGELPEVGVPRRLGPSARMALSPPRGAMRGSSDAPPAGLRPAVPGPTGRTAQRSAFPGGRCHLREWRCLCLAAPCGGAAMRRPLACGQPCRPEVGVPWRPVPSARMAVSPPRGVMPGSSDEQPAARPAAVPTRGRRFKPFPRFCSLGGARFRAPRGARDRRSFVARRSADRRAPLPSRPPIPCRW